ncbi:Uncharacterised protein [Vibrio cholerae]|nr:Uncharacterised protein [Vibrio cholerae]
MARDERVGHRPAVYVPLQTGSETARKGQCRTLAAPLHPACATCDSRCHNPHQVPNGFSVARCVAVSDPISNRIAIRYQYECRADGKDLYAKGERF